MEYNEELHRALTHVKYEARNSSSGGLNWYSPSLRQSLELVMTAYDKLSKDLESLDQENMLLRSNHMDAPGGPRCACGAPSTHGSGSCQRCVERGIMKSALQSIAYEADGGFRDIAREALEKIVL